MYTKQCIFDPLTKNEEIELEMARLLAKIVIHIPVEIVTYIKEKNIEYRKKFKCLCDRNGIDFNHLADTFLYENSDCVFPGVRRFVGEERKQPKWKNNINIKDGTILNDNTTPRHIWSYLAGNTGYSGGKNGSWRKTGLDAYEVAHVFSHKNDERNFEKEIFSMDEKIAPYGLFTSASNVVLFPKGFAKPTDSMELVKKCFYKRHIELYGNNLNGYELKDNAFENINEIYEEIKWREPVLEADWESRIDKLLEYRKDYLFNKYCKNY